MTGAGIIQQLDNLLKSKQLDTRAGLHFLGELVKDAFQYIENRQAIDDTADDKLKSFETRIGNVEKGLYDFLELRKKEQEETKDERKFYRRAVIGGIIAIALSEVARWIIG